MTLDGSAFYLIGIIIITCILVLLYARRTINSMPSRHQPKPFERINFYIGLSINIPLAIISIYSLLIARQTYLDSQISGPAQQAALEGSRKALESVISISKSQKNAIDSTTYALKSILKLTTKQQKTLSDQQKILSKNLGVSSKQYTVLKEQQRILSLKPKLEFLINLVPEGDMFAKGLPRKTIVLTKENLASETYPDYDTYKINMRVKNVGEAVAYKPYFVFSAIPDNIIIRGGDAPQYFNTNASIINRHQIAELPLFVDYNTYIVEDITVSIPKNVNVFYMAFKVSCYSVPTRTVIGQFMIIR